MTEYCYGFVEDAPLEALAQRLLAHRNQNVEGVIEFKPGFPVDTKGVGNIKKKAPSYHNMAKKGLRVLVMIDLDTTPCAPVLIENWFNTLDLPPALMFRVAVREAESWIMADRANLAKFLGIAQVNIPQNPDTLEDPKQKLLNIIRTKGMKKWHREMLPQGRTASIGPLYNEKLCGFINDYWDPIKAAKHSESLTKALNALMNW